MSAESKKILEMLAAGKISVDEAERLLAALGEDAPAPGSEAAPGPAALAGHAGTAAGRAPKFLRVEVADGDERVDVRVPMALLRAGMKFQALIPEEAREKIGEKLDEKGLNIDLGKLKAGDVDELISALSDLSVNVASDGGEKVKVYCE